MHPCKFPTIVKLVSPLTLERLHVERGEAAFGAGLHNDFDADGFAVP